MRRFFPMSDIAKDAMKSSLSNGANAEPCQFLVDGDKKEMYEIHYVDENLCGFNLIKNGGKIRSFYAVKAIIESINKGDFQKWQTVLDMRSFH